MGMMRVIKRLFIHSSATPPDMDIGADTIRGWHIGERGWSDIGYHFIIRRDGTIERGRPIERTGAHTYRHNHDSVGVCMIGGVDRDNKPDNNFTDLQFAALYDLCTAFGQVFDGLGIYGHRDADSRTQCPSFDAREWARDVGLIS